MAEKIDVYFLRCSQDRQYRGYVGEIENTLKVLQNYVGGLIQTVHLTEKIIVICNDEGKLQQLPLNRVWMDSQEILDYFVGNILCVRHQGEEFSSIEPKDIPIIEQRLIPLRAMSKVGNHLAFVMYPAEFCPEWHE